jgi:TRAP-type C4-dicarboxylate transport system substrate-binding protein
MLIGVSTIAAMLVMAFTVTGHAADKYVIKLASEYPDKHPTIKNGFMPWIKDVKKKTDGKLRIQFFNPNTLCPAKEANSALMTGAVGMIFTPSQMSARGKFPMSSVALLPFMFNGSEAGSQTIWDMYQKYPEMKKEYEGMRLLWQWTSATFEVHTTKKPVKSLEDLKGLKMIVWTGDLAKIAKALGANPVETIPHDTYLALQRGMAHGVICPLAPMKVYKITDVAKHHTIAGVMTTHFYAGVNQKKWDSLPADIRQVLIETTGEKMVQVAGRTLDQGAIKDAQWMKKKGHKFYKLSDEERDRWRAKVEHLIDEWIEKMEGKGFKNARQIVEDAYAMGAKYAQTTTGSFQE